MLDILTEATFEFLDGFNLVSFWGKLRKELESFHRPYYSRNRKDEGEREPILWAVRRRKKEVYEIMKAGWYMEWKEGEMIQAS